MGFRKDTYAKVWEIEAISDTRTKIRLSTSRKNKQTQQYEQDFSGFVSFVGSAVAKKAANLKEGALIKLGDVDVTTYYDKEKQKSYTNFSCFSFELRDDSVTNSESKSVDDGEPDVEPEATEEALPY